MTEEHAMTRAAATNVEAASLYRLKEGLGIWEHRGKVAAVGIGHSPTARRWDGDPQTSVGAWAIDAIRKAIADAGITPDQVDGLVLAPDTTTGSFWPEGQPIPEDFLAAFERTDNPLDGLARLSTDWVLKNMPELTNVQFVLTAPLCMSMVLTAAIQAVGDGLTHTCLAVKGWHNFPGRYYQGGANAETTVSGPGKYGMAWAGPASYTTAQQFQRYMHKYGKDHDMMAPFVVNSRRNGLLFPEGYWAQHRPEPLTAEDYINARWVAKPANLFDNDIPIQAAAAYLITTAERAKDMAQKPVYVLGHAGAGMYDGNRYTGMKPRGLVETLEEAQANSASTGRKLFEASGITAKDLSFENMYDGFGLFHVFHIEGIGYAGIKEGEALDLFKTDISIDGPNPVSPSGGNIGGGRTRFWNHTDSIQQIQGRAGARQIAKPAEVGLSGGFMPFWSNFIVWSATPD
jgi:acetyl-CoA acetyltransferase